VSNFEEVRGQLEELGWPDGRSIKHMKTEIEEATSFIDDAGIEVKKMSQRLFCLYDNIRTPPKCDVCGGYNVYSPKRKYENNPYSGWTLYCSKECAYRSERRMENFKKSMADAHGVEFSAQSKDLLKKKEDTMLARYGVRHAIQSEDLKEKIETTMIDRYGCKYSYESPEITDKIKTTMIERYGFEHALQNEEIKEKARLSEQKKALGDKFYILSDKEKMCSLFKEADRNCKILASKIGVSVFSIYKWLSYHEIPTTGAQSSKGELEVCEFLDSLGVSYERTNKDILGGKHLDIFIREKNLAIEFNGLYFHSTKFKNRGYHKEKTMKCLKQDINLIHIWSDQWDDEIKREIIKNKIRIELGLYEGKRVYARNTTVRETTHKATKDLLNINHIQGSATGSLYLGCYDNNSDNIVGCMIFRKRQNGVWELVRFCTDRLVVGCFSKMLKFFMRTNEWCEIISYADMSISRGGVYEKNGFDKIKITQPSMFYTKDGIRYGRGMFMKKKLKYLPNYSDTKTEKQIMEENGFLQVFDSGLIKYSLKKGSL